MLAQLGLAPNVRSRPMETRPIDLSSALSCPASDAAESIRWTRTPFSTRVSATRGLTATTRSGRQRSRMRMTQILSNRPGIVDIQAPNSKDRPRKGRWPDVVERKVQDEHARVGRH